MLLHVLDAVLGSQTKVQILRALVPLNSAVSGREAQKLAGVHSDRGLRHALTELVDLGVLKREETRSAYLYRVNREHDLALPLEALFDAESRRLAAFRSSVEKQLKAGRVAARVKAVVLFGSGARGDARPASDADLLFVTTTEAAVRPVRDAVLDGEERIFSRFGVRVSPLVLSLAKVRDRYRGGDPLMQNIEAEGRVLLGPSFHELIERR